MTSLFVDRLQWTAAEHRAAAAVLGFEAFSLIKLVEQSRHHHERANSEAERIAHRLTIEAAHYADQALKEEEIGQHAV